MKVCFLIVLRLPTDILWLLFFASRIHDSKCIKNSQINHFIRESRVMIPIDWKEKQEMRKVGCHVNKRINFFFVFRRQWQKMLAIAITIVDYFSSHIATWNWCTVKKQFGVSVWNGETIWLVPYNLFLIKVTETIEVEICHSNEMQKKNELIQWSAK